MDYIDLHTHTTASDGTFTPTALVAYAKEKGLKAVAVTDHDTLDGLKEAMEAGKTYGITVIPGIEISSEYMGADLHMLGLNIHYEQPDFVSEIDRCHRLREERNDKMIARLNENGFHISEDDMQQHFGDSTFTRAHYAKMMIEKGYVKDTNEAFRKYLNPGMPCYIPREKITPQQAIRIIKLGHGKPVLAHPLLYHLTDEQIDELVGNLVKEGLVGIEAMYSLNKGDDTQRMTAIAEKHGLFITGGSDFHGAIKPDIDLGCGKGDLKVPVGLLENL